MFDQTGVGKETKIPYYADYDYYKHWILLAKSRNPDWGDSLFARWDAEVFISKPGPRYVPLYSGPYLHTFIARVTPCVEHCRSYGEVCTQT